MLALPDFCPWRTPCYTHQIPISAAERLAIIITLRKLAKGDSQQTVAIARARAIANQYTRAGAGAGARAKYELAIRFLLLLRISLIILINYLILVATENLLR